MLNVRVRGVTEYRGATYHSARRQYIALDIIGHGPVCIRPSAPVTAKERPRLRCWVKVRVKSDLVKCTRTSEACIGIRQRNGGAPV